MLYGCCSQSVNLGQITQFIIPANLHSFQFDLVCKNRPWAAAIHSTYMAGVLFGSLFMATASDRYCLFTRKFYKSCCNDDIILPQYRANVDLEMKKFTA